MAATGHPHLSKPVRVYICSNTVSINVEFHPDDVAIDEAKTKDAFMRQLPPCSSSVDCCAIEMVYVPDEEPGVEHRDKNAGRSGLFVEAVNRAIALAACTCPDRAPHAIAFLRGDYTVNARLVIDEWRASFATPVPAPSVIQAYIAETKALAAAKRAVDIAVERAQSEAEKVTTSGQPLSFAISSGYLDLLCAALEYPERVYRVSPRRADMLQRLGVQVEVVYRVPERVYLAQAPLSRDTETESGVYIRMRMPA